MKKIIIFFILSLLLFTIYFYFRHPLGKYAITNGYTIRLEIAVTAAEKEKGLGDRDTLPADSGMLFVYPTKNQYGFWMKGMRFPLDFIWIDGATVVDLSENIPPPNGGRPAELAPKFPVDKVLEVNAGLIRQLGISVGDTVRFSN